MKPRTQPDLASTLESQGGQPPRRAAASFNHALQATPVGVSLVVLSRRSGVPELGRSPSSSIANMSTTITPILITLAVLLPMFALMVSLYRWNRRHREPDVGRIRILRGLLWFLVFVSGWTIKESAVKKQILISGSLFLMFCLCCIGTAMDAVGAEREWVELAKAKDAFSERAPTSMEPGAFAAFLESYSVAAGELADQFHSFLTTHPEGPYTEEAWKNWMEFLNIAAHGIPERMTQLVEAEQSVLNDPKADSTRRQQIRNNQIDRIQDLAAREQMIRQVKDEMKDPNLFFCSRMIELAHFMEQRHALEVLDEILELTSPPAPEVTSQLEQLREEQTALVQATVKDDQWLEHYREVNRRIKELGGYWKEQSKYYRNKALALKQQLDRIGKAMELRFTAADRSEFNLRNLRGRVVLLDFWATWCPPCIVGIIQEVRPAWLALREKGFEVVGISYDTEREPMERFLEKNHLGWTQYFHKDGMHAPLVQKLGAPGPPAYWLIDQNGVLVDMAALQNLKSKVERLLKAGEWPALSLPSR